MILALDVGNSQIYGGVYDGERLSLQFRKHSRAAQSSDELGLFLRQVLRENGVDPKSISKIALCSVVPDIVHSLRGACQKYFGIIPFILQAGTKTGLRIRYRNPLEVGADRIANSIGATHLFPNTNLIVIDFGTATTFDVVNLDREYLGGLIIPGPRSQMEALVNTTAKLPAVEIVRPEDVVGRSTIESIQSGLYYGTVHMVRGINQQIQNQYFRERPATVIGTGGFSRLFEREGIFDKVMPELVLEGLKHALELNQDRGTS
ncbi:MAG: type III pantothenate kinase [Oligoflexia bacterium]|nr:type III pantothenate kinase [Oligoflexia bacterium]